MGAKLFISYGRKDSEFARKLADDLIQSGLDVWIDAEDIPVGKKWSTAIQQGLDNSETMILILSPESMTSTNVEDEWQYFLDERKLIVPVLLRPAKIHFQLKRLQYVDFHGQPYEDAFRQLCAQLGKSQASSNNTDVEPPLTTPIQTPTEPLSLAAALPQPFEWIDIPAGKTKLTEGGYVTKGGQLFDIPAFSIGKYLVTNGQFGKFVDANGYSERQWWTDEGWQAKQKNNWTAARYWSDVKWNHFDFPVVGISWFEAIAFCQWLGELISKPVTLPTEQQWQRAAIGDKSQPYPWGEQFDATRCNFDTRGTTAVTQYEGKGDSPFGVVDMSGNVWEWCKTSYDDGIQDLNAQVVYRVLRGGSWTNTYTLTLLRASNRYSVNPSHRMNNFGFRCASSTS